MHSLELTYDLRLKIGRNWVIKIPLSAGGKADNGGGSYGLGYASRAEWIRWSKWLGCSPLKQSARARENNVQRRSLYCENNARTT